MSNNVPHDILNWLQKRGLSLGVLNDFQIDYNGREIVIPVVDYDRNFLFSKYRRNPFEHDTTAPKYKYDKGAQISLYGVHRLKNMSSLPVIITEGELDCLLVNSLGYIAVSSTGGAQSFQKDWFEYFSDKDTIILYDNDHAGITGAFKTKSIIPHARIVLIPEGPWKDVTEYVAINGTDSFKSLIENHVFECDVPIDDTADLEIKDLKKRKKELEKLLDEVIENSRVVRSHGLSETPYALLNGILMAQYEKVKHYLKKPEKKEYGITIGQVKSYPISNVIKFNYQGFANCIWHNEKSPSMKYFQQDNRVYCFGCARGGDIIDVVEHQYNLSTKDAIEWIRKR
jgi:DNA primase